MSDKLLVGPWLGEFGWELMVWVPHVRTLPGEKIVVCQLGHDFLYKDFCKVFEFYDTHTPGDMWYPKRFPTLKPHMPKELKVKYPEYKIYTPGKTSCLSTSRLYAPYGNYSKKKRYDIVIHARAESKYGQSLRNWPVRKYEKLLKNLRRDKDLSVCSIGTKAYHIPGTEDKRFCMLSELADILTSSKVTVGPSSGPMHFASLCHCPHVVITSNKHEKGVRSTNRKRYKSGWNPFDTACVILDRHNWQPPVSEVERAVRKFI